MRRRFSLDHTITSVFTLLLFGLYVLLLLLLLLFSANVYRTSVSGLEENYQLRTTLSYLTTKLRQYDASDAIHLSTVEDCTALCLTETIDEREYCTYIYLDDQKLKELFTAAGVEPKRMMGTTLSSIDTFEIQEIDGDLYAFSLTDSAGISGKLYFHAGPPIS